jgi:hypothetical protein
LKNKKLQEEIAPEIEAIVKSIADCHSDETAAQNE